MPGKKPLGNPIEPEDATPPERADRRANLQAELKASESRATDAIVAYITATLRDVGLTFDPNGATTDLSKWVRERLVKYGRRD